MEQEKTDHQRLEEKLDMIWQSVQKTRKYFLITMWVTLAVFVLPLIALLFAIPTFLNSYTSTLGL